MADLDLNGLNEHEIALVTAAAAGEMIIFPEDAEIRAEVLAALATERGYEGRAPWPLTPKGVWMIGGRVKGRLDCSHCTLSKPFRLNNAALPEGADFREARTRWLDFDNIKADGAGGAPALNLYGAEVDGNLGLNRNLVLNRNLGLTGARLTNPEGHALSAQRARITGGLFARRAKVTGVFDIAAAEIGGQVGLEGATLANPHGNALLAQGARITGGLFARRAKVTGVFDIAAAEIGGPVGLEGATLANPDGNALLAQGARITGHLFAVNAKVTGVFAIAGAEIGGQVALVGATLDGALRAFSDTLNRLILWDATLRSARAAAAAGGDEKRGGNPDVITLFDAKIGRLDMPMTAAHRPVGIIDLSRAHVGVLVDWAAAWPQAEDVTEDNHLILDGFTYEYLKNPAGVDPDDEDARTDAAKARLTWLKAQRPAHLGKHFRPQPWRQLAAVLAQMGYDDEAREISIERRVRARASEDWPRKITSWLLHVLAGYGFHPWRTVIISAAAIVGFGALYALAATTGPMPEARSAYLPGLTPAPGLHPRPGR